MGNSGSRIPARPESNIISNASKLKAKNKIVTINPDTAFNYAVVGSSNSGKSSLVNAIRGVDQYADDASPVGCDYETEEIESYAFPNGKYDYILIWDIPGFGRPKHPLETYFEDKSLEIFDCLIITIRENLRTEDMNLALEALHSNVPVCFVRVKMDIEMGDMMRNKHRTRNPPKYTQKDVIANLKEINKKFLKELEDRDEALKKVPYFFISNLVLEDIMRKEPTPVRFQELRFIDFLINTIKNQRHIVDEDYESYGLESPEEEDKEDAFSSDNTLDDVK